MEAALWFIAAAISSAAGNYWAVQKNDAPWVTAAFWLFCIGKGVSVM